MTTKLSTKPRIPIPKDIQEGDILVMRDGEMRTFTFADGVGEYPVFAELWFSWDGIAAGLDDGSDVVAIERKSQPKKERTKNPRPDKDAAWLLKQADDMSYTATKTFVRRMRAIAKRLNGWVAPWPPSRLAARSPAPAGTERACGWRSRCPMPTAR